jgi:hypothetical protein
MSLEQFCSPLYNDFWMNLSDVIKGTFYFRLRERKFLQLNVKTVNVICGFINKNISLCDHLFQLILFSMGTGSNCILT